MTDEAAPGVNETDIDWLADNEEMVPEIIGHKEEDSEEFEE